MDCSGLLRNLISHADKGVGIVFGAPGRILTILTVFLILSGSLDAQQFGVSRRGYAVSSSPSHSAPSGQAALPVLSGQPAPATPSPKVAGNAAATGAVYQSGSEREGVTPLPNVVRLVAFDQGGQSFGSGSYIGNNDEYGLILSNWHVVCEADGLVHVHFPCGFSTFGAVVQSDKKWDLAMIAVSKPPQSVPALPVSRKVPRPGEPLWIAGHGSGSYRLAGGRCVRYLAPEIPQNGTAPLYEIIELSVSARQGDSGGPILNHDGELAGVLFGSDMVRNTAGSYCERVLRFLNQAKPELEKLPQRPEVFFASVEPQGPRHQLLDSLHATAPPESVMSVPAQRKVNLDGASSFGVRSPSRRHGVAAIPSSVSSTGAPQTTPNSGSRPEVPAPFSNTPAPSSPAPTTFHPPTGIPGPRLALNEGSPIRTVAWTNSNASNDPGRRAHDVSQESVPGIPDPFDNGLAALNPRSERDRSAPSTLPYPGTMVSPRMAPVHEKYGLHHGDASEIAETEIAETEAGYSTAGRLMTVSQREDQVPLVVLVGCFLIVSLLLFLSCRLLRQGHLEDKIIADPQLP